MATEPEADLTAFAAGNDPALDAVRALIAAAPQPMAVFDRDGLCMAANRHFLLRATGESGLGGSAGSDVSEEQRVAFTPDHRRHWNLVSVTAGPPDRDGRAQPLVDARALDFFDTVANALPIMFNAMDTQSRFLFMNRYQAELYGLRPETVIGRNAADLLGTEYGAYSGEPDAEVMRTGRALPFFEESYAMADGTIRHWLTSKVPLSGGDGAVWGVATVSIDVTQRAHLAQVLRLAKDQAEAASRAKSGFLAAMSHELRTPLNAVIGFAELINQQVLGPVGTAEYADYAGHILQSGQHLLELVNDILDFARIESGSLLLKVAELEMGSLVGTVAAMLKPVAVQGGVALVAALPEQAVVIRGDAQRLRQALLHVAGNAVKFTPPGGRVTIGLRHSPRGGAEIAVSDTGIGISSEDLPHLFEAFWQADSGLNRLRQGAGIGLKLARQLVVAHGGDLELESMPGEGTRVLLTVPAEAVSGSLGEPGS